MPGGRINKLYVKIRTRFVFLCEDMLIILQSHTPLDKSVSMILRMARFISCFRVVQITIQLFSPLLRLLSCVIVTAETFSTRLWSRIGTQSNI
jgi:hypothetical protein